MMNFIYYRVQELELDKLAPRVLASHYLVQGKTGACMRYGPVGNVSANITRPVAWQGRACPLAGGSPMTHGLSFGNSLKACIKGNAAGGSTRSRLFAMLH